MQRSSKVGLNSIYARFYGPDATVDGCPACLMELDTLGPVHGPAAPLGETTVYRGFATIDEWAGGGIAVQNSRW